MKKSMNPALIRLDDAPKGPTSQIMTISGVRAKGLFLLAVALTVAFGFWMILRRNIINYTVQPPWGLIIIFAPFVFIGSFFFISRKPTFTFFLGPIYAASIGIIFGTWSGLAESSHPGIVLATLGGTFGVFIGLLAVYKSRIIPVNDRFVGFVAALVSGLLFVWSLDIAASIVIGPYQSILSGNGPIVILATALIAIVGSLVLMLDFDEIDNQVNRRVSKDWEWYAAAGIFTGVAWIYLAILFLIVFVLSFFKGTGKATSED